MPSSVNYPHLEDEWWALMMVIFLLSSYGAYGLTVRWKLFPAVVSKPRGVVAGLLTALIFVGILEVTLRLRELQQPQPYRPAPRLLWNLGANLRNYNMGGHTLVSTNSKGLRETEVPFEKSPGEFRLLCLGDSWTFGQGVSAEEAFPKQLQAQLRQKYPHRLMTVVNAGVPGYSYYQGYYLLQDLLPTYQPDVILMCGFNRVSDSQTADFEETLPDSPLARQIMSIVQLSNVYLLVRKQTYRLFSSPAPPAGQRSPQLTRAYANAMVAAGKAAGARIVVFDHAFFEPPLTNGCWYRPLSRSELQDCVRDPAVVAASLCPPGPRPLEPGFGLPLTPSHPSAKGHASMATALLQLLEDRGVLASP